MLLRLPAVTAGNPWLCCTRGYSQVTLPCPLSFILSPRMQRIFVCWKVLDSGTSFMTDLSKVARGGPVSNTTSVPTAVSNQDITSEMPAKRSRLGQAGDRYHQFHRFFISEGLQGKDFQPNVTGWTEYSRLGY